MQVKTCQLCGKLTPTAHRCKQCKREVCEACYKHKANLCSQCYKRLRRGASLLTFPLKLFLLGFSFILVGTTLLITSSILKGNAQTTTGIVILIGPIPIILGTGSNSILAILIAVMLTILSIGLFLLLKKGR